VDPAELVDTTEQSVLVDLVPQANGKVEVKPISKATLPFPADLVDTTEQSVLVDLAPQANLAGLAKVTPISKAVLASPVHPAGLVNTKDLSVLVDHLAGRAEVTPMSKATLAVSVLHASLGAAKVRANRPSAAKTRIYLSASKSIRR